MEDFSLLDDVPGAVLTGAISDTDVDQFFDAHSASGTPGAKASPGVLTPVATSVSRDNVPTSGTPPRAPRSKLVNTPLNSAAGGLVTPVSSENANTPGQSPKAGQARGSATAQGSPAGAGDSRLSMAGMGAGRMGSPHAGSSPTSRTASLRQSLDGSVPLQSRLSRSSTLGGNDGSQTARESAARQGNDGSQSARLSFQQRSSDGSQTARHSFLRRSRGSTGNDGSQTARASTSGGLGSTGRRSSGGGAPPALGTGSGAVRSSIAQNRRASSEALRDGSQTARERTSTGPSTTRISNGSQTARGRSSLGVSSRLVGRPASGSQTARDRASLGSSSGGEGSLSGNPLRASLSGGLPGATEAPGSAGLQFEYDRLRNELRASHRELEKVQGEANVLLGTVATKDKALAKAAAEGSKQQDRALAAEQKLAAAIQDLRKAEADKQKAMSQSAAANREADKLTQKLYKMPKGKKFSDQVAALDASVKALKANNSQLAEDLKAATNTIRAKDRELDAAFKKVAAAEQTEVRNKELQNSILDLKRQLEEAAEDQATLLAVQRQNKADLARAAARVEEAEQVAAMTGRQLAGANTDLKAAEDQCWELQQEITILNEQLTRTGAVAARAAGREVQGGYKDEGVVPVAMHLEETRFLQGEIVSLKDKIKQQEATALVSSQLQERLQRQLDAAKSNKVPVTPRR